MNIKIIEHFKVHIKINKTTMTLGDIQTEKHKLH